MSWAIENKDYSQRRACRLVSLEPKTYRYTSTRPDDGAVRRQRYLPGTIGGRHRQTPVVDLYLPQGGAIRAVTFRMGLSGKRDTLSGLGLHPPQIGSAYASSLLYTLPLSAQRDPAAKLRVTLAVMRF